MISTERVERRLAAIFAADVAGYSRLMRANEVGTLRLLTAHREVMDALIIAHGGRIANTAGDSVLAEFPSAVDAVDCAVAIQNRLMEANAVEPEEGRVEFRIGIHVGDVLVHGGDLLGDGVNIAARLETLAEPGGICLSASAHDYVRNSVPLEFTDLGPRQVKNVDEPIRAYSVVISDHVSGEPRREQRSASSNDSRPSIAVLPFTNMSDDAEQEYFADGITEDLLTALSRIRWLFVIARNSSFVFKGRAVGVTEIGNKLGVGYILEGSVRKAGNRVRITGQLIEVATGAHIWADRYDRDLTDIFSLQDEITQKVVSAIEPSLRSAEIERTRSKPTESLVAYDFYLRALPEFYSFTEDGLRRAEQFLRRAVELDPNYSDAWATLADCIIELTVSGWWADWEEAATQSTDAANRAIKADAQNATALAAAAQSATMFGGSLNQAIERAETALELHPNSAYVRTSCAWVFIFNGDSDRALVHLHAARRMSPLDPRSGITLNAMSLAHLFARRFEEAERFARRALEEMPSHPAAFRILAASLAGQDRIPEARVAVQRLLAMQPNASISRAQRMNYRSDLKIFYSDSLRRAGLPE